MSGSCLPLSSSFVCLVGTNPAEVVLVPGPLCRPLCPLPLRPLLLHDWSFCHYFLAAGGDPGNLVNPLTTNCLLLPCCLGKQLGGGAGWGGGQALVTYKSHAGGAGSHCHSVDPCSPDSLHFSWFLKLGFLFPGVVA